MEKFSLKSQRTQKDITNALLNLLINKKFDDISVGEICAEALITRPTFYKYYEDKYHLFFCIIEDLKEQIFKNKLQSYKFESIKQLFMFIAEVCLDFFEEKRTLLIKYINNVYNEKINNLLLNTIENTIQEILKEQKDKFEYTIPIKILSKFFAGGLSYLGFYLLENDKLATKEQLIKYLDIILDEEKLFIAK